MTVADNTSRNQYTATPSQALFAYTFEIVDKDDIVVLINGIPLSEGTDYTVTGVGSDTGGNIVLTSGTTGGNIVTIYRDMPYARTQNYTNSGDFLASEVNSDFDNLWLAGEQTNRAFSQSIRKPITDSDSISMELPEAASRASKFLKFDANGAVDLAAGVTTDVDADDVSIADAGGYYTSDNVEGALQEIGAQPPGFDPNTDSFNIGSDAVSSGTDSIALGHDASATAARDIALGFDAVASGGGSIAIGQETDSTGVRSIAIGKGAQSTFSTSIALGENASTLGGAGGSPVAIGYNASSTGISGISLGPNTTASGSQSISIGDSVSATGADSIAIGRLSVASGEESVAIGRQATASTNDAVAIGQTATASGLDSIAIGEDSEASGEDGIAIGQETVASGYGSTALGVSADATAQSATALGERALGSALNSTAVGYDAEATGASSIAIGDSSRSSGVDAIALGHDASADSNLSIALGQTARASAQFAVSIGVGSDASRIGSIALGKGAQATGAGSTIAIGEGATTFNGLASPIAIGYQANTTGAYGVGLGYQTVTSGAQSIAIGYIASATNDNSIAIGRQLTVAGQKAVGIGWGAVAGSDDSIGIGTSANALTTDCISIGASSSSLATGGIAIGNGASIGTGNLYGVAVGYGAQSLKIGGVAVGNNANCDSQFGTALGRDSNASTGGYATALGYGSVAGNFATAINNSDATGQRSVAIGNSAVASADDSIAIGYNADALGADSIAIGNIAGADAENTIHINASGVDTNQPQTAGYIVIETDDASLNYDGSWSLTGGPLEVAGGITTTGNMSFGDNDKAIFGAGSDLEIYHDGSDSRIADAGTGYLAIDTNGSDIRLTSNSFAEYMAKFEQDGAATLYHNGSAKIATTSTGIDVTGFVNTDGIIHTGDTDTFIKFANNRIYQEIGGYRVLDFETSSSKLNSNDSVFIQTGTTTKNRIKVNQAGDVSFYEDTGTTPKFFWDASTERLGIGTSSPASALTVFDNAGSLSATLTDTSIFRRNDGTYNPRLEIQHSTAGTTLNHTYSTGASNLMFSIADSEVMRINLAGQVGIGTDSPSSALELAGSAVELSITDTRNGSFTTGDTVASLGFYSDDTSGGSGTTPTLARGAIDVVSENTFGSSHGMVFRTRGDVTTAAAEAMRINSEGNVGIGTTSIGKKLTVDGSGLRVQDTASADFYSTGQDALIVNNGTANLRLWNNGSEAMRIDSNQNLLVGKTSVDTLNTVGAEVQADGQVKLASDGKYPLQLNRLTSDGEIINLRKDGSTVGSIGSRSVTGGNASYIQLGLNGEGLAGSNLGIIGPANGGSLTDGVLDLGYSGARFKDLHLSGFVVTDANKGIRSSGALYLQSNYGSGTKSAYLNTNGDFVFGTTAQGIYLGGTAAGNKLDDYEEGTWTPTLTFGGVDTGNVYGAQEGTYTKIGNTVYVTAYVRLTTLGSGTGNAEISGLPFTVSAGGEKGGGSASYYIALAGLTSAPVIRAGTGGTVLEIRDGNATATNRTTHGNFTGTSDIRVTATYFV